MLVTKAIAAEVAIRLIASIRESQSKKGLVASGRSMAGLTSIITIDTDKVSVEIWGVNYYKFLQRGRGPGRYPKPSRELVERIREWTRFKGIDPNAAYPIAFTINRDGINVPNKRNPGGVLSEPLAPENVTAVIVPILRNAYKDAIKARLFAK